MPEILEKQKMDVLKVLADTNIKISEAKNTLFKIQEDETEYLKKREEKALVKVQKVLDESKEILDKAHSNYEDTHKFCQTISNYSDFLGEAHGKFTDMLDLFNEKNELWDKNAKLQYEEIARQRKIVEQDTKDIETREKAIKEALKIIENEKILIASRQASLKIALDAEKKLWDKLQKISK